MLSRCHNLKKIIVRLPCCDDIILSGLTNLEFLNVTGIETIDIIHLKEMVRLKYLHISFSTYKNLISSHYIIKNLEELHVSGHYDDARYSDIVAIMPKLKIIKFVDRVLNISYKF